jgi:hypothetical protein
MIKLQIVESPDHVAQAKALFQEYADMRLRTETLSLLIVMENWPDVLRCTNWLTVFVK